MSVLLNGRAQWVFQGSSFEDLQRVSLPSREGGLDFLVSSNDPTATTRVSLPPREGGIEEARAWLRRLGGGPAREVRAKLEAARVVPLDVSAVGASGFSVRPIEPVVIRAARAVFHRDPGKLHLRIGRLRASPELAALAIGDALYLDERAVKEGPLSLPLLLGRALAYAWQQQDGRTGAALPGGATYLLRDPALEQEADVYAWLLAGRVAPPLAKPRRLPGAAAGQRSIAPSITITAPEDVPPVARRVSDGKRVRWILKAPKEVGRNGTGTKVGGKVTAHRHGKSGGSRISKEPRYRFESTGPTSFKLIKLVKTVVRRLTLFAVSEITFGGGNIAIEYARIPDQNLFALHETYIRTGQYNPRQHLAPVVTLPAGGNPHWTAVLQHGRAVSWPAAYIQGAVGATLTASFTATGNFNGAKWIQATSNTGVQTNAVQVNFVNGAANNIVFQLTVPAGAVRRLSGFDLDWQIGDANPPTQAMGSSTHTLFLVEAAPRAARGERLFEIFDWACGWAHGAAGPANVVAAIWNQFSPVQNAHPTRLVYWKNHQSQAPLAQDLPTAVQSRDFVVGGRRAASCIVFDRVFINCLAIHGIQAAEVMLTPAQYNAFYAGGIQPCFFTGGMFPLCFQNPTAWRATTVVAHGNAQSPDSWQSHWICAVHVGGSWTLYDPSYGVTMAWGGFALPGALPGNVAIPAAYENVAVHSFPCTLMGLALTMNLPSASPNPPHLAGSVLWHN